VAEGWRLEPLSDEQIERFRASLGAYERDLREWLAWIGQQRKRRRDEVAVGLEVGNPGGAPARGAHIRLAFGDGFRVSREPDDFAFRAAPPRPPRVPRRHSRLTRSLAVVDHMAVALPSLGRIHPHASPNPLLPFSDDPLVIELDAGRIPHGRPTLAEPFFVLPPGPGSFAIDWEVHADNLLSARRGRLALEVREAPGDLVPIARLEDLSAEIAPWLPPEAS
jgi:hypothetical protein